MTVLIIDKQIVIEDYLTKRIRRLSQFKVVKVIVLKTGSDNIKLPPEGNE